MTEYMIPARPGWEPLRISISAEWANSRVGALIGFVVIPDSGVKGIAVLENGEVAVLERSEFTVDWRYDAETDRWSDVNAPRSEETDQEI
jgi:hypothetical protein